MHIRTDRHSPVTYNTKAYISLQIIDNSSEHSRFDGVAKSHTRQRNLVPKIKYSGSSTTRVTTLTATVHPNALRNTLPRALQVENSSTQTVSWRATWNTRPNPLYWVDDQSEEFDIFFSFWPIENIGGSKTSTYHRGEGWQSAQVNGIYKITHCYFKKARLLCYLKNSTSTCKY